MSFDFSNLQPELTEIGAECIFDPPEGFNFDRDLAITYLSRDSEAWEKQRRNIEKRTLDLVKRGRVKEADSLANAIEALSALALSWRGFREVGSSVDMPFSRDGVKQVLQFAWIREQSDEFVSDRANFFRKK